MSNKNGDKGGGTEKGRGKKHGPAADDLNLWRVIAESITPLKNQNLHNPHATDAMIVSGRTPEAMPKAEAKSGKAKEAAQRPVKIPDHFSLGGQGDIAGCKVAFDPDAGMGGRLDKRLDERLRRGQMPIDLKLDLHGHTQDEARQALERTLMRAYHAGLRCVLVVTGKGSNSNKTYSEDDMPFRSRDFRLDKGILKKRVPEWLGHAPLRDIVLQTHPAKAQHGGSGALYVLLRRKRL